MKLLSDIIEINRRYARSINLERDYDMPDSITGYIPTTRAVDVLQRFIHSCASPKTNRSWTITGVYGTGKSAFAHFLSSLCAASDNPVREKAFSILKSTEGTKGALYNKFEENIPKRGILRALATASSEPISNTIIKALNRSLLDLPHKTQKSGKAVLNQMKEAHEKILHGYKASNDEALNLLKSLAEISESGILIIIDEMGKNLEYSVYNQSINDLYLLQQISELPSRKGSSAVFLLCLMHRSFSDYASTLSQSQRNEWGKIHGRFEDIPFSEEDSQVIKLMGSIIKKRHDARWAKTEDRWAENWEKYLHNPLKIPHINKEDLKSVCPLHPLTTMVLPILCHKFAQNDRTLFTFMTGGEPYSFRRFLERTSWNGETIAALKLHDLYDYFVESVALTGSISGNIQKWAEIQEAVQSRRFLPPDLQNVLKTVGILNLCFSSGSPLKASMDVVTAALCDNSPGKDEFGFWKKKIGEILDKNIATWWKNLDEIRLWEGSDFDIQEALSKESELLKLPLPRLMSRFHPLSPVVAQRHSYKTGTLRYFRREYGGRENMDNERSGEGDGYLVYWLDKDAAWQNSLPADTKKPRLFVKSGNIDFLSMAAYEYGALKNIINTSPVLLKDGVARKEVVRRTMYAKERLDSAFGTVFNPGSEDVSCSLSGRINKIPSESLFNSFLSDICDETYNKGTNLWNELINRQKLTPQGAKARKDLIEAMIDHNEKEQLNIKGYGPERSIYESMIKKTGIHRKAGERWEICEPHPDSGIYDVWKAMEEFCLSASENPAGIHILFKSLKEPPYGVKEGPLPVLLAAILIRYSDELSLYMEETFVPIIRIEHFELLMKRPELFAVKSVRLTGFRANFLKEIEDILSDPRIRASKTRNRTLLSIVRPLVKFANNLPDYSKKTKELSSEARKVREALFAAKEPDVLLFEALPKALGIKECLDDKETARIFRDKLLKAIKELNRLFIRLMDRCESMVCDVFNMDKDKSRLKNHLNARGALLTDKCLERDLRSFIFALANNTANRVEWLESLMTVVSDKPPKSWSDEDVIRFEQNLCKYAKRFMNFEALLTELPELPNDDFEAKRITLTKSDGNEINKIFWIEKSSKGKLDTIIETINQMCGEDRKLLQASILSLTEKLLEE